MSAVERVIEAVGGMSELARLLTVASKKEVSTQRVFNWKTNDRIPSDFCPDIEKLTGIPCEELRPDVAWSILREQAAA